MLTRLDIINANSETLSLMFESTTSGYKVKSIEGLDPVAAEITTSDFALIDGVQFQSERRGARNIVLKLGYVPDYVNTTVSSLRAKLYKWFMPKSNVKMYFYKDIDIAPFATTTGKVETFENALFSQDPEVSISIICPVPDFVSFTSPTVTGATTTGSTQTNIVYDGSSPTGFLLTVGSAAAAGTGFTIYLTRQDGTIETFEFAGTIATTEFFIIDTRQGQKSILQVGTGGVSKSGLYGVSPSSVWPRLYPGTNKIRIVSAQARTFTLEYTPRFGGL